MQSVLETKIFQSRDDGTMAVIVDGRVFYEVSRAELTTTGVRLFNSNGQVITEAPVGKATAAKQTVENMPDKTRQQIFAYLRNDDRPLN